MFGNSGQQAPHPQQQNNVPPPPQQQQQAPYAAAPQQPMQQQPGQQPTPQQQQQQNYADYTNYYYNAAYAAAGAAAAHHQAAAAAAQYGHHPQQHMMHPQQQQPPQQQPPYGATPQQPAPGYPGQPQYHQQQPQAQQPQQAQQPPHIHPQQQQQRSQQQQQANWSAAAQLLQQQNQNLSQQQQVKRGGHPQQQPQMQAQQMQHQAAAHIQQSATNPQPETSGANQNPNAANVNQQPSAATTTTAANVIISSSGDQQPSSQKVTSRWIEPMVPQQIEQFIETYMPWMFDQRRRAQEQGLTTTTSSGQGASNSGTSGAKDSNQADNNTVTNLLKVDENQATKFAAIEQTQSYKQLLRYNPAAAAAMKAGVKCPERLAIYIERAFSKCISDTEREFMRDQLEKICLTSKHRGDFFIKQWELMPLPCLQRESTSYQAMNDRLIRGDQNTSLPYHDQFRGGANQQDRSAQDSFSRQGQSGGNHNNNGNTLSGNKNNNDLQNNFNNSKAGNVTAFNTGGPSLGGHQNQNQNHQNPHDQYNNGNQQHPGGANIGGGHHNNNSNNQLHQQRSDGRFSANHSAGKHDLGLSRENSRDQSGRQNHLNSSGGNNVSQFGQQQQLQAQHLQHFSNSQQNFSTFNQQVQNATAQDMDMYKRLKRLEKFEDQLKQKHKQNKPKLMNPVGSVQGQFSYGSGTGQAVDENQMDLDELAKHLSIKGTCMTVEKSYFRLTQAPDPCDVRPEPVLMEALKMLESKWNNKKADYKYIDDQFRSLRQDLTVQRIQNDFCIKVYETHARIALEEADLDQFNQCQTQLRYLYRLGFKGNRIEFLGYQFLYYVFCELETETLRMLKTLTPEEKLQEPVAHALKTRNALVQCNYGRFFKLYQQAPGKASALIDVFIDKIRIQCLQKLVVGFIATNIELNYLAMLLAFPSPEELEKFLVERGCTFIEDKNGGSKRLNCKDSIKALKSAQLRVRRCKK